MNNIVNYILIRYINLYLYNEKYALKSVTCEGRQLSVICHVEAVLEGFSSEDTLTFGTQPTPDSHTFSHVPTF